MSTSRETGDKVLGLHGLNGSVTTWGPASLLMQVSVCVAELGGACFHFNLAVRWYWEQ